MTEAERTGTAVNVILRIGKGCYYFSTPWGLTRSFKRLRSAETFAKRQGWIIML